MKQILLSAILLIQSLLVFSQVIIDGNVYLEDENTHDSIQVIFNRILPTIDSDTAYTDLSGYFSISLTTGFYEVKIHKDGYFDIILVDEQLFANKTFEEMTLIGGVLFGSVMGILPKKDYHIKSDIVIQEGDTLIIQAGSTLYFDNNSSLTVRGLLIADGKLGDTITFTKKEQGEWSGIVFEDESDDNSMINYSIIEYSIDKNLKLYNCNPTISHSIIRNATNSSNSGAGIYVSNSSLKLLYSNISHNQCYQGAGIYVTGSQSSIHAFNCLFDNNTQLAGGNGPYGTVIYTFYYIDILIENSTFINNRTPYNLSSALILGRVNAYAEIINCYFYNNWGESIAKCDVVFRNNAIINNTFGTALIANSSSSAYNNIIYNNGYVGMSLSEDAEIYNNIISQNNGGSFDLDYRYVGKLVTENQNGDSIDVFGNLLTDPLIIEYNSSGYILDSLSPAIDAGFHSLENSNSDIRGNIRVWDGNGDGNATIDIGPYEYGAPFLAERDVSLQSMDWPLSGCELSSTEQIQLTIKNFGTVGEKAFSVSYSTDGGLNFITETYSDSLPPGESGKYSFSQSIDFSTLGDHDLIVAISVAGDQTFENDTLRRTISHYELMAIIVDSTNISCNEGLDGSATVEPSGAPGPYYYQWDDDFARNTPTVTGLRANELYTVDVTTTDRCHTSTTVMLTQPEALSMNILELNKATCNSGLDDGSVTVEAVGGIAPYLYQWDDQAATTGPVLENMAPNVWYHVLITDANGCMVYDSVKVTEANNLVTSFPRQQDVSCYGEEDGMAEVAVYFGTEPYSYLWNDAAGSTSRIINDLTGGRYYRISVTDDIGCTALDSVFINEPDPIEASFMLVHNKCYGETLGGINLTVSGGTEPYAFAWSDGSHVEDIVDLPSGEYITRITDANGCNFNDTTEVLGPEEIQVNFEVTDVSCHGLVDAVVNVEVSGGIPGYLITWPDDYISPYREGVAAGTYLIQVRDENECIKEASVTVNEPEMLDIVCMNGDYLEICEEEEVTLELLVSGGTPNYEMEWDNVSGSVNLTFRAVESRTINASVTDANGCFSETSIDIQVNKPFNREEICIVTVNSEGKNMIVWEKTSDAGIVSYNIYKETNQSGQYDVIGYLPVGELSVFTDEVSDPSVSSDRYRIAAVDTCGNESDPSPFHKTIHLAVSPAIPSGNNLSWDHIEIENDAGQYGTYYIYRGTGYDNLELIGSIASSKSQYTDPAPPSGQIYYQVSARKLDACVPSGTKKGTIESFGESFSNIENVGGTGIDLKGIQSSLRIYPNPFTESATIAFSNPDHEPYRLVITDLSGKVVKEEGIITGEQFEFWRKELDPGIYLIELAGSQTYRDQIVIQ